MIKFSKSTFFIIAFQFFCSILLSQDNKKLAQTGFQFLSVTSDARAAGMGNAVTATGLGSSSLFFNPAGLALMNSKMDLSFSTNSWIADISHNSFSFGFKPSAGRLGVFGITAHSVDYGEILGTVVAPNELGYEDTGIIKPTALSLGLGYGKSLSDRFSVGARVSMVSQDLGAAVIQESDTATAEIKNSLSVLSFDFGTHFKTGIPGLDFGMSVRNFSQEVKYADEGFQLPLNFTLGISANLITLSGRRIPGNSMNLQIDATHPRSHPEEILVGLEYSPIPFLSFRGGYISNQDEIDVMFGAGLSTGKISFDYALTPFGIFDNVQRVTIRMSL